MHGSPKCIDQKTTDGLKGEVSLEDILTLFIYGTVLNKTASESIHVNEKQNQT